MWCKGLVCSIACGIFPNQGPNPGLLQTLLSLPDGSDGKESACNAGDPGSIPRLGRSPGEGNGNPLQYSCLENLTSNKYEGTLYGLKKKPSVFGINTGSAQQLLINKNKQLDIMIDPVKRPKSFSWL